jgi:ubiquinone/menaquinone biosynthesis C-methylase UbiE
MAPVYSTFDVTMQTFYYTLVNMLKLSEAKHILEIACGIGKLIPYSMTLKQITCSYLATDFSEKMIEMAKIHVDDYIHKLGVTNSL